MRKIADFFKSEKRLDISNLYFNKLNLWAYLRNYYGEEYVLKNNPGEKSSAKLLSKGLSSLFYGWWNIFRKYDYLFLIYTNQRKKVGEQWVHPFDLMPKEYREKALIIEMPATKQHVPLSALPNTFVISRFLLVSVEFLLIKLTSKSKLKRYNSSLNAIESELDVQLNYTYLLKRFFSGYRVMKLLLKLYKPKAVFCTVSYPIMSYILACKEKNIPVIEMQHGYIGKTHRAYSVNINLGTTPFPDFFLSWGVYERQFLGNPDNHFIEKENVYPVGNFYLDYVKQSKEKLKKKYADILDKYASVVAVSMQDSLEDVIIPFILSASSIDKSIGYLILPRAKQPSYYHSQYDMGNNVFFIEGINTYQGILLSNVHTTIWSTTAIESLALGCPNILINTDGLAQKTLGHILGNKNYTDFADTPQILVKSILSSSNVSENTVVESSRCFFADNFVSSLSISLKEILEPN